MLLVLVIVLVGFCPPTLGFLKTQPKDVQLSYADDVSKLHVTWTTKDLAEDAIVHYGRGILSTAVDAAVFNQTSDDGDVEYFYMAILENLIPGSTYVYHVGSETGWSHVYYFRTVRPVGKDKKKHTFVLYADSDYGSSKYVAQLQKDSQAHGLNLVFYLGAKNDFLHEDRAGRLKQFNAVKSSIGAYIPYEEVPSSFDHPGNFSRLQHRSKTNVKGNNLFYSFDYGVVHAVIINTEFYFFAQYGWLQIYNQYAWLEQDLKKANENRKNVPWVILLGHRTMKCAEKEKMRTEDCYESSQLLRNGLPGINAYGLNNLIEKYDVDIIFAGREDLYQRSGGTPKNESAPGSIPVYDTNCGPVYVNVGSVGTSSSIQNQPRSNSSQSIQKTAGYAVMEMENATHILVKYESVKSKESFTLDKVWIVKQKGKIEHKDCQFATGHAAV